MTLAYWNGSLLPLDEVSVSPLDRGFLFADGVYEVVAVYDGRIFELDAHLDRLARSLDAIRIAPGLDRAALAAVFERLAAEAPRPAATVYIQVTRGAPAQRSHAFPASAQASILAFASPLKRLGRDQQQAGFALVSAPDIRWLRCDIKSIALLPSVLAAQHAAEAGALETVMLRDGLVTECAASNVFVVKGGRVATPAADHRILDGINRRIAIRLAAEAGIPLEQRDVAEAELRAADEIWITSTTKELAPIVRLDGAAVGDGRPGPVWRRLRDAFDHLAGGPAEL
ncbi:D-alanine transaminase [Inquilinus ginsengisoli]|uniref:Probable branched-chain-amino-acid aminotransferase n=1 Tax=Inquilinus ginsengisoli TaxID=363840 RepID=A0ABU1K3P7_9PROT|nr:D-amino acid aminotransferase [Inquilinus ginsengisoli]MDR6294379.1 D-alanine transaminase [Inquilinus ginsengisoli]